MNYKIASWLQRLVAYIIDFVFMLLLPICFVNLVSNSSDLFMFLNTSSFALIFVIFVYPVLYALLTAFVVSRFGMTFGKFATGTRIVRSNGSGIGFLRAFLRNHIGYMISGMFLSVGFLWILIDKERRSWHDQIADTYVVVVEKTNNIIIGLSVTFVILFLESLLISKSISNFSKNSTVYADLTRSVNAILEDTK